MAGIKKLKTADIFASKYKPHLKLTALNAQFHHVGYRAIAQYIVAVGLRPNSSFAAAIGFSNGN